MRVALIADVHGNAVSLRAVLDDIERQSIDKIVCLGDIASTGPQPSQALSEIGRLGCPVILGNADESFIRTTSAEQYDSEMAEKIDEIDAWCADQLAPADLAYIETFQPTVEINLAEGWDLLCFHGSPRSNSESIVATTPDEDLEEMIAGTGARVLAGGHTHIQLYRRLGSRIVLNSGSVGLPFEQVRATGQVLNPPWAEYSVVELERAGALSVDLRRVWVDVHAVVAAARESGMPHAEWWVEDWMRS